MSSTFAGQRKRQAGLPSATTDKVGTPVPAGLALARTVGNRGFQRAVRASPRGRILQRRISDTKKLALGTMSIEFDPVEGDEAGERGWISFLPNDNCPDTDEILLEQILLERQAATGKPAAEELEKQSSTGAGGGQAGFYIDQVAQELGMAARRRLPWFVERLSHRRLHYYKYAGLEGGESEQDLVKLLRAWATSGDVTAAAESGIAPPQARAIIEWWKRDGFPWIADVDPVLITKALLKTLASAPENDTYATLAERTGIDELIWERAAKSQNIALDEPGLRFAKDRAGAKHGKVKRAATLQDTPQHNAAGEYQFQTAAIAVDKDQVLGVVSWGFAIVPGDDKTRFRVKELPVKFEEPNPLYAATATEARTRFYEHWKSVQPEEAASSGRTAAEVMQHARKGLPSRSKTRAVPKKMPTSLVKK